MSEPTYRIAEGEGKHGEVIWLIETEGVTVAMCHDLGQAERIAALLSADDERIAREGHERRLDADARRDDGMVANQAWLRWERAIRDNEPLADLDALEAAYRATLEQP